MVAALLAVALTSQVASAQIGGPGRGREADAGGLVVDWASFMAGQPDSIRLEVYYQYFNHLFRFKPVDGEYRADFEVVIRIRDDDGRQVEGQSATKSYTVKTEERAESRSDFRTNQASFVLPAGKYRVELTIQDLNANVSHQRELKVNLKKYKLDKPRLSDIELVTAISVAGEERQAFDKGDFSVVPSVTKEFGDNADSRLVLYMEIYRPDAPIDEVLVETAIRRRYGSMEYRDSLTAKLDQPVVRQIREISIDSLVPGEYDIEVRLRDKRERKLDERTRTFYVAWSLETMLRNDIKSVIRLLSLIASPNELDSLEKALALPDRQRLYNGFWVARDPTPGTEENEIRQEFYRRVKVANASFGFMRQPGWNTDRGTVYVKHGEPDQVDDYPLMPSRLPYQEWHYYRGSQYRKFTFVDRNGDGDYRLVYPYDGLSQPPDF